MEVGDLHHFIGEQESNTDQHQNEKSYKDPDPHQVKIADPQQREPDLQH